MKMTANAFIKKIRSPFDSAHGAALLDDLRRQGIVLGSLSSAISLS